MVLDLFFFIVVSMMSCIAYFRIAVEIESPIFFFLGLICLLCFIVLLCVFLINGYGLDDVLQHLLNYTKRIHELYRPYKYVIHNHCCCH